MHTDTDTDTDTDTENNSNIPSKSKYMYVVIIVMDQLYLSKTDYLLAAWIRHRLSHWKTGVNQDQTSVPDNPPTTRNELYLYIIQYFTNNLF
jgi:hypothetical protein